MRRSRPNILRLRTLARGRVRGPLLFYLNNTNTKVIGPFRNCVENPAPAPIVLSQEDDRQRPGGLIEMGRERAFDGMQTVDRHYPWLATVASSGNFRTAYAWGNGPGWRGGWGGPRGCCRRGGGWGWRHPGWGCGAGWGWGPGWGWRMGWVWVPAGAGPGSRVSALDGRSPLGEREYSGRRCLPSVFRAQLWRTPAG